jgi:amino acid transporter
MPSSDSPAGASGAATARGLSTGRIVFLVVAAAAPMAAMVGNTPLALALGSGPGLPAAYLLAAATLLCFAVGYAAMARHVVNTGAFYTYVAYGLGKPPAVAAAYLAVTSYSALTIGLAAAFGYFVTLIGDSMGVSTPWPLWSALAIVVVAALGYRSIDLSATVLGTLMVAEIVVLLVLDGAILLRDGAHALPVSVFTPSSLTTAGIGGLAVVLMFAFTSFVGFESAALYGEEAREPHRTIPRATYLSVVLIGVFYLLCSWLVVGALGVEDTRAVAAKEQGNLLFMLSDRYAGGILTAVMGLLLSTSVLASMLAVHNAATRYLFALGRERLLPAALGTLHPRRYAPARASLVLTAATAVVVALFAIGGWDPYLGLAAAFVGLSTVGVVSLQLMASLAVVGYFRRVSHTEGRWRTVVAPLLATVGLAVALVLVLVEFPVLTGVSSPAFRVLPAVLMLVLIGGGGYGVWLRRGRPQIYADLASVELRQNVTRTAATVASYRGRYCVIGAGPAGLAVARQLAAEGIGYDQYERGNDVGGIWDVEAPGSPMYDSAHFISSVTRSAFAGHPMPADYPDYPSHTQILCYLRGFADAYQLRPAIRFGVGVEKVEPLGAAAENGWRVTLSTGRTHDYRGVVCASGANWNPHLPDLPGSCDFAGEVRHAATYRSPSELVGRRVLVLGGGNSGVDIACDAAVHADQAYLSLRRGYRFVPKHLFGLPADVFAAQGVVPTGFVVPIDLTQAVDGLVGDLTRYGVPAPDHDLLASHPVVNDQVVHHLTHGDLTAVADVASLTTTGVELVDGRRLDVDLVLLATGYEHRLPYLDDELLTWRGGRPQLFVHLLARQLPGLSVMGALETAAAYFPLVDQQASLVVLDAHLRELGGTGAPDAPDRQRAARWRHLVAVEEPSLQAGHGYLDSPRHTNYVDSTAYPRALTELRKRFGWPDPVAAVIGTAIPSSTPSTTSSSTSSQAPSPAPSPMSSGG